MIESEEKRRRINETVERWAKHTKVEPYLREYDIPSLVDSIITEFYHVCLCCGHWVKSFDDGIDLEIDEPEGKEYGSYCKDCADKYIKAGFARLCEVKDAGNKG